MKYFSTLTLVLVLGIFNGQLANAALRCDNCSDIAMKALAIHEGIPDVYVIDTVRGVARHIKLKSTNTDEPNNTVVTATFLPVDAVVQSQVNELMSRQSATYQNTANAIDTMTNPIGGIMSAYDLIGNSGNQNTIASYISSNLGGLSYLVAYANAWFQLFNTSVLYTVDVVFPDGSTARFYLSYKNGTTLEFKADQTSFTDREGNNLPNELETSNFEFDSYSTLSQFLNFYSGRGVIFTDSSGGSNTTLVECVEGANGVVHCTITRN